MLKSMTGFANADLDLGSRSVSLGLKSYNNRYLDVSVLLPPSLSALERRIQALLSSRLRRGKVEFSLRMRDRGRASGLAVDPQAARAAFAALAEAAAACGLEEKPSLALVIAQPGVLCPESELDVEAFWSQIEGRIGLLLEAFEQSREVEGAATAANLRAELDRFGKGFSVVQANLTEIEASLVRQLKTKMEEYAQKPYDEARFLQEIAVQLMRCTINEEVQRLKAHLAAFDSISKEEAPAKRLDFLCQEMNREVNTIGSKNILVPVAHAVVEMKDSLENIREQLRNLE